MKVFLAGATGVIGRPLTAQLLAAKHEVVVMTRSDQRAADLRKQGATAIVCDVFDRMRHISCAITVCEFQRLLALNSAWLASRREAPPLRLDLQFSTLLELRLARCFLVQYRQDRYTSAQHHPTPPSTPSGEILASLRVFQSVGFRRAR